MDDSRHDACPAPAVASGQATPRGHSLRRNVVYAVVGNGALALCRVLVIALLAKLATPEIQGKYIYASVALAAPVVLFFGLELRAAFVADAGGEFAFGAYRALRSLSMTVAAGVLLVVVLWVAHTEPNGAVVLLMLAICAGRIVVQQGEIYWGVFQRRERLDLMAWSNVLRSITLIAPFALLLRFAHARSDGQPDAHRLTQYTAAAAIIHVAAWTAIWWLYDRRKILRDKDVDLSWNWPAVGRLAWHTLPLGLVLLIINLCETVTQWLVKRGGTGDGWSDVGFYGALRLVTLAGTFLVVQIGTAAGNRLATYYQQPDLGPFLKLAAKVTAVAAGLGLALIVATWLIGRWFLGVMYTPEYAEFYPEFLILVASQAVTLLAAAFGFVTTHMRKFWIQVPVQLAVLGATIAAGILLIGPDDPVRGGAWTTLVRSITQAVLYLGCVFVGVRWRKPPTTGMSES